MFDVDGECTGSCVAVECLRSALADVTPDIAPSKAILGFFATLEN